MAFHMAAEAVRGEPDYAEQVPRLASFRHAHPDAEIIYLGSYWEYFLREGDGATVITRPSLGELLDKLEASGE